MKRKYMLSLVWIAAVILTGCIRDYDDTDTSPSPAYLTEVSPRSGSTIARNAEIIITCDSAPLDVSVKERINGVYKELPYGRYLHTGKRIIVKGLFAPGELSLKVKWYGTDHQYSETMFNYTVVPSK